MELYNKIIKKLLFKKISVSTVESCTGGLLAHKFTSVSGISKIYNMGLVLYSNNSKSNILKIKKEYISTHGAVSYEISKKMLINLNKLSKSHLCISTTGIAGPKGGTKNKPVGTVFIGIKFKKQLLIYKKNFKGNRKEIQNKTINFIFKEIKNLI